MEPRGKIVLSIDNGTYNGSNADFEESQLENIIDNVDQTVPDACLRMTAPGPLGEKMMKSEVQLYLQQPKFITHVEVLVPNYESSKGSVIPPLRCKISILVA